MRAGNDTEGGVQKVMYGLSGYGSHTASPQEGDSWEREWGGNPGQSITSPTKEVQCGNQRKREGWLPQYTVS